MALLSQLIIQVSVQDPEGPSTQYFGTLAPNTTPLMVFGARVLKYQVLGASFGALSLESGPPCPELPPGCYGNGLRATASVRRSRGPDMNSEASYRDPSFGYI